MGVPHANARFPTTHWSLVARAGLDAQQSQREALGELLVCYLPALRAHLIYGKRIAPEDADDLLQEFVAEKIIEKALIGRADAELGKFRTFLLTSLDRFCIDRFRQQSARKRSPDARGVRVLGDRAEQVADDSSCDAFDLAWARQVIAETTRRMQAECEASGRKDVWGLFECRLLNPLLHAAPPVDYAELTVRFGLQSPSQASNLLITAKRMFARVMRAVVGQYANDDEEIEAEMAQLLGILAKEPAKP